MITTVRQEMPGLAPGLVPDSAHTLHDGQRRWPVIAGIPWLRAGRDELRERAVRALDAGDVDAATVLLLADADEWWDRPPPPEPDLRAALSARTMREAVALLGLERVGSYLLHRGSDPTWLACLALTATHPPAGRVVIDLACGAGHLLRHLALHGERRLTGIDVVFAKLWLARRFVLPPRSGVRLLCADLTAAWPLEPGKGRYVTCHDALYFLTDKHAVLAAATAAAGEGGAVVFGHCHNAEHPAGRSGLPLPVLPWLRLLPDAHPYTDEELTAAALDARAARPAATVAELRSSEAVALVRDRAPAAARPALTLPPPRIRLRPNPIYVEGRRRWPDAHWQREYATRAAQYLPPAWPDGIRAAAAERAPDAMLRRRLVLDVPELW